MSCAVMQLGAAIRVLGKARSPNVKLNVGRL